jgi:methionyl-tRNA formyltransferase
VTSLYERIMARSLPLVGQLVADAAHDRIPHRHQPAGAGSYYSSTSEEDFRLDWNQSTERIRRYVTATPGRCFAEIRGRRVHFLNAESEQAAEAAPPGTLLWIRRTRAAVATNPGIISSSRVQVACQAEETFADLCRRLGLVPEDTLV